MASTSSAQKQLEAELEQSIEVLRQAALLTLDANGGNHVALKMQQFFGRVRKMEQLMSSNSSATRGSTSGEEQQILVDVLRFIDEGRNPDLFSQQCDARVKSAEEAEARQKLAFKQLRDELSTSSNK